jgi:hypothetical protein
MRPLRRLVFAALGLGLLLAGCSDDDPPDWLVELVNATTTTTAAPGASTTTTLPPVPGAPTTTAIPGSTTTPVTDLSQGQCIVDAAVADWPGIEVETTSVAPCEVEHHAEVFALVEVEGAEDAPFPGAEALSAQGEEECQGLFADYVGIYFVDSRLDIIHLAPTETSWEQGDRQIVCTLFDIDGAPLTGSVQGQAV